MTKLEPIKKQPFPGYSNVSRVMIGELKTLVARHGGSISPELVLQAARNKNSVLHDRFEWDDSEAAEKYRMIQARYMLSVAVEVLPGTRTRSRVFVSLSKDRYSGGGYRTTVDVMNDTQMHQQMLDDALENMEHFRQRYQYLKELKLVINAMKDTAENIKIRKR